MNRKRTAALLLLALLALPLVPAQAIGPINRDIAEFTARTLDYMPEAARARTDSLVVGVSDLPGETNPFFVKTSGDDALASLLYDELLFVNNKGEWGDGVATIAFSNNNRTCTFTVRDSVRYPDGSPVTSDDFINALYLLLMPGYDGAYDLSRAGIVGVSDYLSGESASIAGIRRVSDSAFSVTTATGNPNNLAYFAIPALRVSLFGQMQRPETLNAADDFTPFYQQTLARVRKTDASQMAYGQYGLIALEPGASATFAKNTSYWRGSPYIGTVILQVVPIGSELSAIMDGVVDIVSMLGSIESVDIACDFETGFINLYTWPGDVLGYLGMDLENAIFKDLPVRQALAIGFNREAARMDSVERYGEVPNSLAFDSFSAAYGTMLGELYPYDPARAAQCLEEAGWVLHDDGLRYRDEQELFFTFYYNSPNPILDVIVSRMQRDYKDLGIGMLVERVSFEELTDLIERNACDMYFQARRLPASALMGANLFVGEGNLNQSGYDSDRLSLDLRRADYETDPARQTVLLEGLYQDLYMELPFIPLYRRSEMLLVNARVFNVMVTYSHSVLSDAYRFLLKDTLEGQW